MGVYFMIMFSIIMPAYNSGRFIDKSIESVLRQTYQDFELIVINDGSKDNTQNVVESYINTDKRIKLINIENNGVSNARNIGIKNSVGEYISFLDSDDFYDSVFLEKMYHCIKKYPKNDFFYAFSYHVDTDGKAKKASRNIIEGKWDAFLSHGVDLRIPFHISAIMIKKQLIDEYDIKFDTDVSISEDIGFYMKVLTVSPAKCVDEHLSYYNMRDDSVMHKEFETIKWQGGVDNHQSVFLYVEKYWPSMKGTFLSMWGYRAYKFIWLLIKSGNIEKATYFIDKYSDVISVYKKNAIKISDSIKCGLLLSKNSLFIKLLICLYGRKDCE